MTLTELIQELSEIAEDLASRRFDVHLVQVKVVTKTGSVKDIKGVTGLPNLVGHVVIDIK